VTLDDVAVTTERRKALGLLAYLAAGSSAAGGPRTGEVATPAAHSREALAALLWPDYDQSRAMAYLRRTLWELNQVIGPGWVVAERDTVSLAPTPAGGNGRRLWVDVQQFRQHVN
jgi:hypothetical protein